MKRKNIQVMIEGVTPMICNRFHEDAQLKVDAGTSMSAIGDRGTPREQTLLKVYRGAKDNLIIPGPNVFSCIIIAGKFHKVGKRQCTTGKSSLIPAGISVVEVELPILNHDNKQVTDWEVDVRRIVNPATGGGRNCYRPRFDQWRLAFTLDVDVSMFDPKFVRTLVDDAGQRVGLGDFRPDRRGPFGKFKVVRWDVTDVLAIAV